MGVVFGDIGTSPIYALRESLQHTSEQGVIRADVIGIVSLLIWAVIVTVTFKYVLFIMRADKVGRDTVLAQIVQMVAQAQRSRAPIQRLADQVAG